jgi:hypothetical protein
LSKRHDIYVPHLTALPARTHFLFHFPLQIGMIEVPYAAKLLFQAHILKGLYIVTLYSIYDSAMTFENILQELMAMQIAPRLMTSLPGDWRLFDQR